MYRLQLDNFWQDCVRDSEIPRRYIPAEYMERFNVASTTRASFALYNTHAEVETLIAALHKARTILG